ncbi:Detected protein of confused Function [Hibiscus syriacus]|uniref:Detected protein of confused Function n=1 Tax=Hibiscus syriacus TaxID=106335 RepID=A0A6A3CSC0_HIBSY|nr:Detected protein of confused Function [Hibiscus syriacus]
MTNLLSKKQDLISKLEQDLANSKSELNEKDKKLNDILQFEANLKSDMEKQKKLVLQFKRRAENFAKEKDQMSKENQALSKLVEELKQGRRPSNDTTGDQVMKEKEEKDTRIQILEKTVERQREELKKEKDEHQNEKTKRIKCERTIMEAVRKSEKGKATVLSELEKYQLALKRISEELEKLKQAEGNLPQGTSVVQLLSGTISDDHASLYLSAAEDFERVARSILTELGTGASSGDVLSVDTSATALIGTAVPDQGPVNTSSTVPVTRSLSGHVLSKLKERQGDVEMSEATSHDVDAQGTQQSARKRQASATTELSEDVPVPGETSADVVTPALKKSKGPDSGQEAAEVQAATLTENLSAPQVTEEVDETVGDITLGSNEEVVDVEKEEADTMEENLEESKEPQVDGTSEVGLQENKNLSDEVLDKPIGNEMVTDEEPKNLAVQESQQPPLETESEKEEGELDPEIAADTEGGTDVHNVAGSSDVGGTELGSSPLTSPSRVEDEALVTAAEGDNSPDTVTDDKNDEGDIGEETIGEGFEKTNDGNEQSAVDTDPMPEAAPAAAVVTSGTNESGATSGPQEGEVSKNTGNSSGTAAAEAEDVKQTSPISGSGSGSSATSTLVNLQERARERAMLRQAGVVGSSTTSSRGRGRVTIRGRGTRGRSVRGGRAGGAGTQNPDQQ